MRSSAPGWPSTSATSKAQAASVVERRRPGPGLPEKRSPAVPEHGQEALLPGRQARSVGRQQIQRPSPSRSAGTTAEHVALHRQSRWRRSAAAARAGAVRRAMMRGPRAAFSRDESLRVSTRAPSQAARRQPQQADRHRRRRAVADVMAGDPLRQLGHAVEPGGHRGPAASSVSRRGQRARRPAAAPPAARSPPPRRPAAPPPRRPPRPGRPRPAGPAATGATRPASCPAQKPAAGHHVVALGHAVQPEADRPAPRAPAQAPGEDGGQARAERPSRPNSQAPRSTGRARARCAGRRWPGRPPPRSAAARAPTMVEVSAAPEQAAAAR